MSTIFIAALIFFVDQFSKDYIRQHMFPNQSVPVLPGIFHITYIRNPGAAFGLLAYRTGFFVMVTVLVVALILFFARHLPAGRWGLKVALGLQLGGALGNLVDRLRTAHVVDFLDFRVWPVFNLADVAIVIGALVFFYDVLRRPGTSGQPS